MPAEEAMDKKASMGGASSLDAGTVTNKSKPGEDVPPTLETPSAILNANYHMMENGSPGHYAATTKKAFD